MASDGLWGLDGVSVGVGLAWGLVDAGKKSCPKCLKSVSEPVLLHT